MVQTRFSTPQSAPTFTPLPSRRAALQSILGAGAAGALAGSLGCATAVGTGTVGNAAPPSASASPAATANPSARPGLRLIGQSTLAHKLQFKGTTVGGLSGLDYDREKGIYYAISDDRSDLEPARFYTLKLDITANSVAPAQILSVTTLQRPDGSAYPSRRAAKAGEEVCDPESIRLRVATQTLYWTSEGDAKLNLPPFIREMHLDGRYSSQVPLPSMFVAASQDGRGESTQSTRGESTQGTRGESIQGTRGVRDNLGFEGLAFAPSGDTFWAAMEAPLVEDGPVPAVGKVGGACRITQFHAHSSQPIRQIAYYPDAIPFAPVPAGAWADNGISEVWMASETGMLVLERAYAVGVGNSLRLYWIDVEDCSDVMAKPTLSQGAFKPAGKTLLLDFAQVGLVPLDNTEGMTRGPTLPNGNPTLVFVSDDNFNPRQATQFVAFEWVP